MKTAPPQVSKPGKTPDQRTAPSPRVRMTPAEARRAQKNARRIAAREAARQEAVARKRRQTRVGTLVVVLVLGAVAVLLINLSGGSTKTTAKPSASASAFPQLPPGADPALKTKPTVKAGTGDLTALKVTTLIKGSGAAIAKGQLVTVNYVGVTYKDGKEFDSSWKGSTPLTFTIGQKQVIAGWDQGLIGVTVGSRVQLDIPQALAYPDASASNGDPTGSLRFVIDVLGANAAPSPAPSAG